LEALPTGKEVLLVESFLDSADLMVVELKRFDAACKRRVVFAHDRLIAQMSEATFESKVLYRAAPVQGMLRFLESSPALVKDKRVITVLANGSMTSRRGSARSCTRHCVRGSLGTDPRFTDACTAASRFPSYW
jgi:hypothetical protein